MNKIQNDLYNEFSQEKYKSGGFVKRTIPSIIGDSGQEAIVPLVTYSANANTIGTCFNMTDLEIKQER